MQATFEQVEEVAVPQRAAAGPWRLALRRLIRKKLAVTALVAIFAFYAVGLFAPVIAPYDYRTNDLEHTLEGPTLGHPFGTDRLGRDQLSRVIWSARTTIIVTAATIAAGGLVLSVGLGMLSGYVGGKVDTAIMRTGDVFASLPGLPMLILIGATLRPKANDVSNWLEARLSTGDPAFIVLLAAFSIAVAAGAAALLSGADRDRGAGGVLLFAGLLGHLVLWGLQAVFATPRSADYFLIFTALSLFVWVGGARVIRSQVLALRETDYVLAAQSMGGGTWRVLFTHLLPNVAPIIIVGVSASLGAIAGSEIALTFLGVGVHEPTPSFGALISDSVSQPVLRNHPYLLIFPAVVVGILIFAFNLLGDALNDVLTPRAR
jgi:ABC-type dipeptide/oligopeptide/nickel transport system permease subunit